MTVQKLIKVLVVGREDAYPLAEDALSALKCVDVTEVEHFGHSFVIDGWIPQVWFEELQYLLEAASGNRVTLVWDEKVQPAVTAVPILLENPRLVKPFEYIVQMFSLPGREGYDPTFLTFITFPLFFGFVIGDFGYGAAFIVAGFLVRRWFKTPLAELAALFVILGGLWSTAFGTVLFADCFGFHVHVGPLRYHLLNKLEDITQLLLLSIALGLGHINLGLAIGFLYERRRAGLRVAFLRKISWYILEVGLILLGAGLVGFLAGPVWVPGLALMAVAVALIALGGGITDVVEVPTFLGNILSYLRLGALGVAKGAISVTINNVVLQYLIPLGVAGWIFGSLIMVLGHGFTMALALVTVTVSVLRLHYLEFYTKFYPMGEIAVPRAFKPTVEFPPVGGA